jgi:hypothetical protein
MNENNKYFAMTLANVLEETSKNMSNRLLQEHIDMVGQATADDKAFFESVCHQVITEAADDFIPDTVNVPEASQGVKLFDEAGNAYMFQDGQLVPIDQGAPAGAVQESTVVPAGTSMIEENSSDSVVAKILANLE